MKRFVKWLFGAALIVLLVCGGVVYYFRDVVHMKEKLITSVKAQESANGIHAMTYAEIPSMYRKAVLATEDRRFWWDPGVDPVGIARSIFVDVSHDGYLQGGSTVTQQLVDNTLITRQRTLRYKLTQMFYAVGIYSSVGKKQTFTMYANVIYFGHGAYGLYNAAQTYFGKPPAALNAGELTLLAGLPNAPSAYDPFKGITLARQRQSVVLENMVDAHFISQKQAQQISAEPVRLKTTHNTP